MAKILLADDDKRVLNLIGTVLRRAGHVVFSVDNGKAVLERIEAEPYDIVVTDIMMPGTNGIDIALEMKARRPYLPVLAISGGSTALFEAMAHGADRSLNKPFHHHELLETVESMLRV